MGAVEIGEPVGVRGEVRRDPVKNDGNAVLVEIVHQVHEILRRAVARSWREVAGRLVSPGAIERMFHDGQEFDVSEAQLAQVFGQARSGFAVSERAVVLFGNAHPRSQMNFSNRLSSGQRVPLVALLHPVIVVPFVVEVPDDGCGARRFFIPDREGIGFVDTIPMAIRIDVEFVQRAVLCAGHKSLPHAGGCSWLQTIGLRIPAIKATHNRYAARIGGPDAEHRSGLAITGREMRSHSVVDAVVATFVEEIEVLVGANPRLGNTWFRAHGWHRLVMRISLQKRTPGWYGYVRKACVALARGHDRRSNSSC